MSDLDLEAIRQRCERATEGPWAIESCGEKGDGSDVVGVVFGPDDEACEHPLLGDLPACDDEGEPIDYYRDEVVAEFYHGNRRPHADARFVAHARSDVPALLAEVTRLRAENERIIAVVTDYERKIYGLRALLRECADALEPLAFSVDRAYDREQLHALVRRARESAK